MTTTVILNDDHYMAIMKCINVILPFYKELTHETLGHPYFIYKSFNDLVDYIRDNKDKILRDGLFEFYIKLELIHHSISHYCIDNVRLLGNYNEIYTKIRYGMNFYDTLTREYIDYHNLILLSCGHMFNDHPKFKHLNKCEICNREINFIINEKNRGDSHRILLLHNRLNTVGSYYFSKVKEIEKEENEIDLLIL